ncbi:MAG TPA: DUF998 domain-containing protein [Rubrobacteraceae bacterium]|nr:DUF998 domain-containing protein [Rubrobacteraceae bacterium]
MSHEKGALAGMVGPAAFALVVVALTLVQYDFMVELGWHPVRSSDVPWPSGLALGPLGWLQVANFVLFGLTLIAFAVGLHRGVAHGGRGSRIGPALLILAGVAMVLAGFKTDPDLSGGPQTWHGVIHGLAYFLFMFSLLPALFFLWWRLRRDPRWRGYVLYTLITGVLYVFLFFRPEPVAFYLFLALILVWIEVMAIQLRISARSG